MRYQLARSIRPVAAAANRACWYRPLNHASRDLNQPRATASQCRWMSSKKEDDSNPNELSEKETAPKGTPKRNQEDRPWHRADFSREDNASEDNAKEEAAIRLDKRGRLLTTPTRLLKLIVPLPFDNHQKHINRPVTEHKDSDEAISPLALLVHPQQPLSYLERLIQAEVPPILEEENGRERIPDVVFWAEADAEATPEKSGSQGSNVASYHGLGREGPGRDEANWVRWSGSTEIGDFIRDAARGTEFSIDIEGHAQTLRIAVPSFKDRTHYMRMRLRQMSLQIDQMSKIKTECDMIAHKGAHRLAQGGFAALASWWGTVYYVTFHTDMGWDMVEPVTYLAGLTTIMGGYLWFLFISRDLSYKAAMNITVSRRQNALYQEKGFDLGRWEHLVHDANLLRRDIRMIATEYGVDWDEMKELGGFEVKEALEEEDNDAGKEKDGKKAKKNDKNGDHGKENGQRREKD